MINARIMIWWGGLIMGSGLMLILDSIRLDSLNGLYLSMGAFIVGGISSFIGIRRMDKLMIVDIEQRLGEPKK